MGSYKEIYGDLIVLAKQGEFDVISHGCNCHNCMGSGIAPQMANAFGADKFKMESKEYRGDINKLGTIDYKHLVVLENGTGVVDYAPHWVGNSLVVVNSYTQYGTARYYGDIALDYSALDLCLHKINHIFKGKRIGLPLIGGGLAGGDPETIKEMIQHNLLDCDVTLVLFDPTRQSNDTTSNSLF